MYQALATDEKFTSIILSPLKSAWTSTITTFHLIDKETKFRVNNLLQVSDVDSWARFKLAGEMHNYS